MTRSYKKLWHILLDKDMSRSQLRKKAGISTNALAKLGKDESLPLETLEKVCAALDCTLDDILEYVPDKETDGGSEFTRF
jgi:DNA (cytosine-5)-methyltransferase 1